MDIPSPLIQTTALGSIASAIRDLGNANATNTGPGGQGAIEVLSYQVGRIADALERLNEILDDAVVHGICGLNLSDPAEKIAKSFDSIDGTLAGFYQLADMWTHRRP